MRDQGADPCCRVIHLSATLTLYDADSLDRCPEVYSAIQQEFDDAASEQSAE